MVPSARAVAIPPASVATATQVFDFRSDWSDTQNPNGVWTLREGVNLLPPVSSWQSALGGWSTPQPGWARSENGNNRLPFWFRSNGSETFVHDFEAGDVVVHTTDPANGVGNGLANAVWTSPGSGVIDVAGAVWMGRDIGRANNWFLYRDQTLLTSGHIESGDAFSRASPMSLAQGSGGPNAVLNISVSEGTTIQLEFERTTTSGDFVGVNLSVDFTPDAVPGEIPIAWWRFDESGGTTVEDCAGRYPGTLSGGATFEPNLGIVGGAIELDHATSDLVDMGNVLPLVGTSFSVQTWVQTTLVQNDNTVVVGKHDAGSFDGYMMRLNRDTANYGEDGKASFYQSNSQANTAVSTTTVTDGHWHHVLATYTLGESLRLYVDGQLESTLPSQTIVANNAPFLVGGVLFFGTLTNFFTGLVDEVQIYDYPLSAEQVQFLFSNPGLSLSNGFGLLHFVVCLAGPNVERAQGCQDYDFDRDGDVDLHDYARLLRPFECRLPP
ncbi:MAG: LamG domain-containing protein [Planctomycetes bacterium]|nr:LamG domain-containing protein [Planctomycetota bacterium]